MKKLHLLLIVLIFSSINLVAQRQGLSIGGNVYFPVGDWSDFASIGYGGSVSFEHPFQRDISGVIYSGYTYFGGDNNFSWTIVPLLAGAKFYLTPQTDWYIAGLLGVNFITAKSEVLGGEVSASSTEFAGNVNFGYEAKVDEKGSIDISAGFIFISDLSYFGMRLAYIFRI